MATVINNPAGQAADNASWVGTLIAVLLVGLFLVVFFVYALPLLRNTSNNKATTPSNGGTINIDVPNPSPNPSPVDTN